MPFTLNTAPHLRDVQASMQWTEIGWKLKLQQGCLFLMNTCMNAGGADDSSANQDTVWLPPHLV